MDELFAGGSARTELKSHGKSQLNSLVVGTVRLWCFSEFKREFPNDKTLQSHSCPRLRAGSKRESWEFFFFVDEWVLRKLH